MKTTSIYKEKPPAPINDTGPYTVCEAARLLRIGKTLLYRLVTSGQVKSFYLGKERRITITEINRIRTEGL